MFNCLNTGYKNLASNLTAVYRCFWKSGALTIIPCFSLDTQRPCVCCSISHWNLEEKNKVTKCFVEVLKAQSVTHQKVLYYKSKYPQTRHIYLADAWNRLITEAFPKGYCFTGHCISIHKITQSFSSMLKCKTARLVVGVDNILGVDIPIYGE